MYRLAICGSYTHVVIYNNNGDNSKNREHLLSPYPCSALFLLIHEYDFINPVW
jgi:hypothetical protein